jgi:hypothetical protein
MGYDSLLSNSASEKTALVKHKIPELDRLNMLEAREASAANPYLP